MRRLCSKPNPCPPSIHLDGTAFREVVKSQVLEDSSVMSHIITTCGLPKLAVAGQIFIADRNAPGILYAPLPDPRDDTNILESLFTLIPLPGESGIDGIDYDPYSKTVYWNNLHDGWISRIHLDGTSRETIVTARTAELHSIALDLVNRKIYWTVYNHGSLARANLDGTEVENLYTYDYRLAQPGPILLDPVKGYMLWSTYHVNEVVKASLDGSNREIVQNVHADGMTTEQCADDTTRLFYYTNYSTLGLVNLDGTGSRTITALSWPARGHLLSKYGSKLFWTATNVKPYGKVFIYEYDMKMSYLRIHNSTVRLTTNGGATEIDPTIIRITTNTKYSEPVAIERCPNDIIAILRNGSTSDAAPVSWMEPVLNSWSSCPTMEFLGPGTNGGEFSVGTTILTYRASDAAGNTDICQFLVTVKWDPRG